MERFAQLITGGGVILVAGLWSTALAAAGSSAWVAGAALALAGTASLAVGIWTELDVDVRGA